VVASLQGVDGVSVVLCPPFTALHGVSKCLAGSRIALGAQNCYPKAEGAFTGEVSPAMLLDAGCAWVILGHSERRQYFGESDAFLNEKLHAARAAGLKVMFCIGETLAEREHGQMEAVLRRQLEGGLASVDAALLAETVIAYEPVWAIGTGVTATPDQAGAAHAFVRGVLAEQFGAETAAVLRIQYGGSVKPENAAALIAQPDVDGFLVGGASLDAGHFAAIVRAAAQA
jgi:triosephosphate isomerase